MTGGTRIVWHEGEHEVRARMGVEVSDEEGSTFLRDFMPGQHREFFQNLPFMVIGSVDAEKRGWASVLFGPPGFVRTSSNVLSVTLPAWRRHVAADPLWSNLAIGGTVALVGIDFSTRRRNRLNGKVVRVVYADGEVITAQSASACTPSSSASPREVTRFDVLTDLSFGNCPKYIQARRCELPSAAPEPATVSTELGTAVLSDDALAYIARSDTFFVASSFVEDVNVPSHGTDISHRGGHPGFVIVVDRGFAGSDALPPRPTRLQWPDYSGNMYFNTLGNFARNPLSGLLFWDFMASGDLLQLTGAATILYDERSMPGAQRMIEFVVHQSRLHRSAVPFQFSLLSMSPYLPPPHVRSASSAVTASAGYSVKCIRVENETLDGSIKAFTFKADSQIAAMQKPGMYATFEIDFEGEKVVRTWTISSVPAKELDTITLSIKHKVGGQLTPWLHTLKPGFRFLLTGIAGEFILPSPAPPKLLFVAGGVGVTPVLAMLRGLTQAPPSAPTDVVFLYSVRTHAEVMGAADFAAARRILPTFRAVLLLTGEAAAATDASGLHSDSIDQVLHSRLTLDSLQLAVPDVAERVAYVCGPVPFMEATEANLEKAGVPDSAVHTENFDF